MDHLVLRLERLLRDSSADGLKEENPLDVLDEQIQAYLKLPRGKLWPKANNKKKHGQRQSEMKI